MKILNILGEEYELKYSDQVIDELLVDSVGYCDTQAKVIVIDKHCSIKDKVLRHEVIHAFMYESGLDECSTWGTDETLIDWIALQFPKIEGVLNSTKK